MNKVVFLFLTLIVFGSFSYSQNTYDFLRLDGSARAGALGGSFVSNNDDADVIFYNPAGIELLAGKSCIIFLCKTFNGYKSCHSILLN